MSLLSSNGGLINVGVSHAEANSGSTTAALVGNGLTINLRGDLSMSSAGMSEADATARGGAGGVVTVNTLDSVARSTPTITSEIGFNTTITAGGTVALSADAPLNRDSFDRTRSESGDGYTTAASASSSGGLVSVQDANSTTMVNPTVVNQVGFNAQITAQNFLMNASGTTGAEVLTVGAGGGFVSAGGVDANLSRTTRIQNILNDGVKLQTSGFVNLLTSGFLDEFGKSSADIGGFVAFVSANTKLTLHHDVENQIGGNTSITAGGALSAIAQTFFSAFGRSDADSGGLGANSRSSNSDGQVGSAENKGIIVTGTTSTNVFDNAKLKASSIQLKGQVGSAYARMEARARAGGFGTDADSVANVDIRDTASVTIFSDAMVEATGRVDLIANHTNVNATSNSSSTGASAFGDSDSTSITHLLSTSSVTTQPRSKVIARDLNSEATYFVAGYDRRADQSGGIDFGTQRERGNFLPLRQHNWQGDIVINGAPPDRKLVIDEAGRVEFNSGVIVQANDGIVSGISGLSLSSADVGSVRFHSNSIGTFDGQAALWSSFSTSGFVSNDRPTLTFNDTIRSIDILNRGTRTLGFAPIDVVSSAATPTVVIDINNINTLGTVFSVKRNFEPTNINIQSGGSVFFNGNVSINNPLGSTTIGAHGPIQFDRMISHNLDLRSSSTVPGVNADIGTTITEFPGGVPVSRFSSLELTQTSAGRPSLYVDAGNAVSLSITGLQRVNAPFVANIENLTAQRLNVEFNPAKSQYAGGEVGPVVVSKTKPGSEIIFPSPTFTKNVYQDFRVISSFFGVDLDPKVVNTDVFGKTIGTQSATYQAHGNIEGTDVGHSSIVVKKDALIDYLHFIESASLPNGVVPGAIQEWADINGDGALDLASASGSTLTILVNRLATTGTFDVAQTVTVIGPIESLAFGDADFDGDLDLAMQSGNVTSLLTNFGGTFTGPATLPFGFATNSVGDLAWADFDNDGDLDLLDAGAILVIRHFENGSSYDAVTVANASYSRVDVGDFDRDGDIDILAGGRGLVGRILENQNGTFLDTGIEFPRTVNGPLQFGDADGDGDLDVMVLSQPDGNGQSTLSVYENEGDQFVLHSVATGSIGSALWNDHDADGDLDLLVHFTNPDRNQLFINVGVSYIAAEPRDLPDGVTLQGWSTANIVNGRGTDLLYAGTQNGQPFHKVFENLQPVTDSAPPVPSIGATVLADTGFLSWSVPAPSAGSSPYTFNVRIQKLGEAVQEISTPSGRGAVSGNRFNLTDVEVGAIYFYSVQTVDSLGRRSAWASTGVFISSATINVNVGGGLDQDVDDGDIFNGQTTLREAINYSNAHGGGYTVNLPYFTSITVNPLTITKPISIVGTLATQLVGNGSDRIFNINDGTSGLIDVSLSNFKLTGGRADFGGAIYSTENLSLSSIALQDNRATQDGGAVYLDVPVNGRVSFISLSDSQHNQAGRDGGVIAINNVGLVEFIAGGLLSQFHQNSATRNGGGISIVNASAGQVRTGGRFEAIRAGFSTAGQNGGGVSVINNGGFVDLSGLSNEVNQATGLGGGIYLENHGGTAILGQRQVLNKAAYGGGYFIVNDNGSVLWRNGTAESNQAQAGGGMFVQQTGGRFAIEEAYIELNKALGAAESGAGAIAFENNGGEFTIRTSLIRNNQSASVAGALRYSGTGNATATISGSTFTNNTATRGAGLDANVSGGEFNVTSNTFSGNSLTGAGATGGAGIDLDVASGASGSIVANTIAFNDATASATGSALDIAASAGSTVVVRNTLIADNPLASGASAYQFSGDATGLTNDSNWIGNNAGLLPLALNGGLVPTHSLSGDSPAINQGADALLLPAFDQRGDGFPCAVGRPDIGAIERLAEGSRTIVVSTPYDDVDGDLSDGKLSFSEAIRLANASPGEDTIVFAPSLDRGTVGLASSPHFLFFFQEFRHLITDSVKIIGPGADRLTLSQASFVIDDGNPNTQINVEISGLTLKDLLFGLRTSENTTLNGLSLTTTRELGGNAIQSRPDAGATVQIENSFLGNTQLTAAGSGLTIIDNSTITALAVVTPVFGGSDGPNASVISESGSLIVRNSTLIGQQQVGFSEDVELSLTSGGIIGSATVISSIVPYVGAGSTVTNSLIGNGDPAGLAATFSSGTITIDTTGPAAPVITAPAALTNDATPTISGTAEANSRIHIVVDPDDDATTLNSFALTTTASGDGNWSIDVPAEHALFSGLRASFRVTATDALHNTGSAATGSVEIETTPPAAPIVVFPATVNSRTPTFQGLAEPGSTVTIIRVFSNFTSPVATVTADAAGHFTFVGPETESAVEAFRESVTLLITATDAAGNASSAMTGSYLTDSQAPFLPSITLISDDIDPTRPELRGEAEPETTVTVTIDPDDDAATSNSFDITTTATGFREWFATIPAEQALTIGNTFGVRVVSTDAAGNVSAEATTTHRVEDVTSNPPVFTSPTLVNDATPTITFTASSNTSLDVFIDDDNNPATINSVDVSGSLTLTIFPGGGALYSFTVPDDHGLADGQTVRVSVTAGFDTPVTTLITADLTAPEAPVSSIPDWFNTTTPTLIGTAEALSTVLVTVDPDSNSATSNGVTFRTTADADGSWSVSVPANLGLQSGSFVSVSITSLDAATNLSAATNDSFVIDATAPMAPTLYVSEVVQSATPTLAGLAEPFSTVTLVIDPDNDAGTDNSVTLATTASANGVFRIASPIALAGGTTASLIATSTDFAGNSTSSTASTFAIDLTDPTIDPPVSDEVPVPSTGGVTNDTTPNIFGTARPNSVVNVVIDPDSDLATDNSLRLSAVVDGDGHWNVTVPDASALLDGTTATVTVSQADTNGNLIGSASGGGMIDPGFGVVTYLGGRIPTASLRTDSLALNAGSNPLGLAYDSRGAGFARVTGAAPDIGAYELQPAIFTVSVTEEEDDGDYSLGDLSFREAILLSNRNPGTDTIRFAPGLTTIPVSLVRPSETRDYLPHTQQFFPQVAITDSVNIEGPADRSLTLAATQQSSFVLPGGSYRYEPVIIIDDEQGAAITVRISGVTLPNSVVSRENLILENVRFAGNDPAFTVLLSEANLTVIESDIDRNMTLYEAGAGVANSTIRLEDVSVNAPSVFLRVSDATAILDNTTIDVFANDGLFNLGPTPISSTTVSTNEDTPVEINLQPLAVGTIDSVLGAMAGTVSLNPDEVTARFQPAENVNAAASFQFKAATEPTPNVFVLSRGTVNVTITPVDDPVTISLTSVAATEDQPLDVDLRSFVVDPDSPLDGLSFTLGTATSAEATLLPDGHTVRLTFTTDYFGSASFTFDVTDGTTTFENQTVAVNVTPVNDAPTLAVPAVNPSIRPTQTLSLGGIRVADIDSANLSVTVAVTSGKLRQNNADTAFVALTGTAEEINAQLDSLLFVPQAGISDIVGVTVRANDGVAFQNANFLIGVAVNEAPILNSTSDEVVVTEGEAAFQSGNFSDPNGDAVTITASIGSVSQDADGTWVWSFTAADGPEDSRTITITATDSDGANSTTTFQLTVNNAAPTPATDGNDADNTVSEGASNGDLVGITAASTDVAGDSVTYSLTDDAGGRFQIDPNTGVVTVRDASLLDFESATSHTITVRASDGTANSTTTEFTIAVTNVAPTPPADGNDGENSLSEQSTNGDLVGITAAATDLHGGRVTFTLTDDAGGRFQIDPNTGIVTVKNASLLNFEDATSHSITVQTSDGIGTSTSDFTIAVTNVAPPQPTDRNNADDRIAENAGSGDMVGIAASAIDINGGTVTYSLTNDAGGRFQIDSNTGVVTVRDASLLDFETTTSHTITVRAFDGTANSTTQDFTITVTNVAPDAPTDSSSSTNAISEGASNGDSVGLTAHATDIHGGSVTYSLTNDAGGRFQIDGNTGVVTVRDASLLDFESTASHTISVQATDGLANSATTDFVIAVSNVAPTAPIDSNDAVNIVSEAAKNGDTVGIRASASDVNGGTITYSLTQDADGRFQINGTTGVVTVKNATLLNFEGGTTHAITVQASDGMATSTTTEFTIAVTKFEVASGSSPIERTSDGKLTFTDINRPSKDNLTLSLNGDALRLSDPAADFGTIAGVGATTSAGVDLPTSKINRIAIDLGMSADLLTVDFTAGNPIPLGGVTYNGGFGGGDGLILKNAGLAFTTTIVRPLTPISGSIEFLSGNAHYSLSYTGLSSVRFEGTESIHLIFDLTNTANTASLGDVGKVNDGKMRLSASGQLGAEFSVAGIQTLSLFGNGGNDRLTVNNLDTLFSGQLVLEGGDGDDSLDLSRLGIAASLIGGTGKDTLTGGSGDDSLIGGDGNDLIRGNAGQDLLLGGAGNDKIEGGLGHDTISADAGDDSVYGGDGNDVIRGGTGNDRIHGGNGNDTLLGDAGKDSLHGEAGNDILLGGIDSDEDSLNGGSSTKGSRDTINGQIGLDKIIDNQNEIDATFTFDFDRLIQST